MTDQTSSQHVTQAEFARRRGVSRATVTEYKGKGLLVMTEAGLVDVAASEERLAASLDPSRGGDRTHKKPPASNKPDGRFMAARTEEMEVKTARQRLALAQEAGLLVEKAAVERTAFTLARTAQEAFIAIPDRLATSLAAESDPAEIHKLLSAEIRAVCQHLAKATTTAVGAVSE
jgi:hypothetical protein